MTCPGSSPTSPAGSTPSRAGERRWPPGSTRSARRCPTAIADGARIIVLSDRHSTAELAPIPSLLLTGAVHHHLVREKTRTQVGLVIEAGDVREVHHVALLIGYGAAAVNPYLAMETVEDLARDGHYVDVEPEQAVQNLVKVARQGRPQGDEQDGRLDGRVLHRRPDLRGRRALPGAGGPLLHRHHQQARRHRHSTPSPRRSPAGTARPTRSTGSRRRTAPWRSAASTSGAARASRTCSTPRRSSGSSTRRGPAATTCSSSTPRGSTSSPSG